MYQLIATVQTFSGMIDRVVAENASLAMIEETRELWNAHPGTLLTRIEIIYPHITYYGLSGEPIQRFRGELYD